MVFSRKMFAVLLIMQAAVPAACSSSTEPTIKTVVSQPTLAPPLTPTPHQFTEADLEEAIYKEEDLPAVYNAGQIADAVDDILKQHYYDDERRNIPQPDFALMRKFERDGEEGGRVIISVYKSSTQRDRLYQWKADEIRRAITSGLRQPSTPIHTIPGLGSEAVGWAEKLRLEALRDQPAKNFDGASVTFKRCEAVVDLFFLGNAELDTTVSYAKRIDKRLKSLGCQ